MSLHSELKSLFGKNILSMARSLEPGRVDALAVREAAGALSRLTGKPLEQMALVQAMKPETAAALCRWLSDPAFWALVGGITRH